MLAVKGFLLLQTQMEMWSLIGLSMVLENFLQSPALSQGLVILGLIHKHEIFTLHRAWLEYIYFHTRSTLCLWLTLIDIVLCAAIGAGYLSGCSGPHFTMWFLFLANILLLKSPLELLTSLHLSYLSIRALSCVIFTPWFCILKAGLQAPSGLETWLLCGSFFILLAMNAWAAPLLTQWALLPFEWKEST